jgi:hypothetical protein
MNMDMRQYVGEQFIKVDDVRAGPLAVQIKTVKQGKFDRPEVVFESGETFSLNVNNTKILTRAYGPDSTDWHGKKVTLELGKVEYQGALQDSVVVKPVSPPLAADERAKATTKMAAAAKADMDDSIPF